MRDRRILRTLQIGSRCWAVLYFCLGALQLSAQDKPVELRVATVGEHYEHALKTSKPARFIKASGNAPWLSVTANGVLTGTPGSDAPGMSEITVDAFPLDATGNPSSGSEPFRRTFVVPVRIMACATRNKDEFSWCDESEVQPKVSIAAGGTPTVVVNAATEPGVAAAQPVQQGNPTPAKKTGPEKTPRVSFAPESSAIQTQGYELSEVVKKPSMSQTCSDDQRSQSGCIVQFDRLRKTPNEFGIFNPTTHRIDWSQKSFDNPARYILVNAVNASKVFLSGSVFIHDQIKDCANWSWSVVTQTIDSSSNLYYGPSDLSAFCVESTTNPKDPNDPKISTALIVLPVQAIWASVYGTPANKNNPTWKPVKAPSQGHQCWTGAEVPEGTSPSQGILPCDKKPTEAKYPYEEPSPLVRHVLYSPLFERAYTRGALPGVSQGSISIDPVALATKSTFDVQGYESWLQGPGWIGLQTVYEHDRKPQDDLNSLTSALTYDMRIKNDLPYWTPRNLGNCEKSETCPPPVIGLRPVEFILRVGTEWSPDAFTLKPPSTYKGPVSYTNQYLPRNVNIVMGSTLRLPIVFSPVTGHAPRQPSQLTVTPVAGLEGGFRVNSHEIGLGTVCPSLTQLPCVQQPEDIFRRVVGVDASGRWPYSFTGNFFGDRPVTMDFSYRKRWLSYAEPFANQEYGVNSNYVEPAEGQSAGGRTYTRITLIQPASAYFQLRVVWQHGSLPPAFQYVGNLVAIGVTFSNPGVSEH